MKWSTEPPAAPGWYWFRERADSTPTAEHINHAGIAGLCFATILDQRLKPMSLHPPGEWYGPIEVPA